MLKTLFEIEDWLISTTDNVRDLTRTLEPRFLLESDAILQYCIGNTQIVLTDLNKYRDNDLILKLKAELRSAYLAYDNPERLSACVNKLLQKFNEFWEAGSDFQEFYHDWRLTTEDESIVSLDENFYEIRSFFKHETWDLDPYNFKPTIQSILIEYIEYYDKQKESIIDTIGADHKKLETEFHNLRNQEVHKTIRSTQDLYISFIREVNQLPALITNIEHRSFYENEPFKDQINTLGQEFENYFSVENSVFQLRDEILRNLRTVERDGLEFSYVKELNALFTDIDSLNSCVKSDNWENYFIEKYQEDDGEMVLDNGIHNLLETIKRCTEILTQSRAEAINALQNSLFVQERPTEFPAITNQHSTKPVISDNSIKLKWNCKPAVAGYIISDLIRAGYIEPPITNGELSYAKLASICNQIFNVNGKDGKPTTLDYWKKIVNPESNPLADNKRAKLNLPDYSDLA